MPPEPDDRLLRPYRPVRHVTGGADAPWPGQLVTTDAGEHRLLVDATVFDDDWSGWSAGADGHLLAPLDVVRRATGHDVAFPACAGTVEEFLRRRGDSRVPLCAGEAVTLAVSMLRGLNELGDDLGEVTGRWWLTDAGRPVLATGLGTETAVEASRVLLDDIADALDDTGLVDAIRDSIDRAGIPARELVLLEQRLFEVASAEPLSDAPLVPTRVRTPEPVTIAQARRPDDLLVSTPASGMVDRLARHVDADIADLVSRATTDLWRRLRTRPISAPRGRVWTLAAGAAVAVVAAGMLWPTDAGTVAAEPPAPHASASAVAPSVVGAAEPPAVEPSATGATDPGPSKSPLAEAPDSADLAAVASTLLTARVACDGDSTCLAEVLIDPAARFAAGAAELPEPERTTVVLDDFGGVAVLRVDAADAAVESQLVVIQKKQDEWLLRDVYVAQQP